MTNKRGAEMKDIHVGPKVKFRFAVSGRCLRMIGDYVSVHKELHSCWRKVLDKQKSRILQLFHNDNGLSPAKKAFVQIIGFSHCQINE